MNPQSATRCHSTDEAFEHLLEEITCRIQAGESVALEDYAEEHPAYADRLRQLLPAMQALLAFGTPESAHTTGLEARPITNASGILGDFRIVRELGRGGMGVVYEAEQISIGRPVALKVLPFASMLDDKRLARFRNEIRAAGQLHHTNIVPIFAVGSDRGVHFYAMQLVAGQTLAEIIADLRQARHLAAPDPQTTSSVGSALAKKDTARAALSTLPESGSAAFFRAIAELAVQAADALEHAHSCGIVHRDIKPSNLMVDQRGCVWLTDFGLASIEASSDLTMTGELLGTLRYMSPEQTLGSRVVLDNRTDIYSLGVTLYELLTHRPAFDATDRAELLRRIASDEPTLPRRLVPTIPNDLETIVLKAMSKDAASRYATAQALADDLHRFLENKPIVARRPTLVDRGRKWITRHAAMMALAATMLALIAAFGAVATWLTLGAYRAEAEQRIAAEANLAVASQIIDRMLTRSADDHYYQGDLKQAETLAADASKFYDDLLERSDDPELRFRAAEANGNVAQIWELVGRYEKAGVANRRAGELLQRLTTQFPGEPRYLVALASNFNRIGMVDWSLDRPSAAESPWRQAWEIWTELAERFPHEPSYQDGVARTLANLGCVCYFTDRFDEAEEYYRRADAINEHLPDAMKNSAEGLASNAGSLTNQAEMARLRGKYDRAIQLLEESIPYHQQTLKKWPTNPVALDCYFYMFRNMTDCYLDSKRPADAAKTVEQLVEAFPDRLEAYHFGAEQLLRCAALAETVDQGNHAEEFRQRARALVAKSSDASQRTPDAVDRFAWFLLTCEDKSFRDPPRALELAMCTIDDAPERGDAWFTLALAQYRCGDWLAAEKADEKSIKLSRDGKANAYDWLLQSMIRANQGRREEARRLHEKARDWIAKHHPTDKNLLDLAAEADVVHSEPKSPQL